MLELSDEELNELIKIMEGQIVGLNVIIKRPLADVQLPQKQRSLEITKNILCKVRNVRNERSKKSRSSI